eukprot:3731708-Prymnesium_polylepis.1
MDVFKAWDESGDGRISPREFRRAMASIGVRATKDELDGARDGPPKPHAYAWPPFLGLLIRLARRSAAATPCPRPAGVFGSWDETSNGSIEFEEMDRILRRVARDAKEREAAAEAFDNQEDNGKLRRLISGVGGGGEGEGEGEGGQRTPGSLWRSKTKGIALGAVLTDNTSPLDQLRKAILGKGTAMSEKAPHSVTAEPPYRSMSAPHSRRVRQHGPAGWSIAPAPSPRQRARVAWRRLSPCPRTTRRRGLGGAALGPPRDQAAGHKHGSLPFR